MHCLLIGNNKQLAVDDPKAGTYIRTYIRRIKGGRNSATFLLEMITSEVFSLSWRFKVVRSNLC